MPKKSDRSLLELMGSYGFQLQREKKHFVFKHSSGAVMITGATRSDRRSMKNIERDIKRVLGDGYASAHAAIL